MCLSKKKIIMIDEQGGNDGGTKKSLKKCERKQKRAHHRFLRDINVKSSEEPTKNVAICNAGLVTGFSRETLHEMVKQFASDFKLNMPTGKSYSFVEFDSKDSASAFYQGAHGKLPVPCQNTIVYLVYVESIPSEELNRPMSSRPKGLRLLENFITPEEEVMLLESINWAEENKNPNETLKNRKVKHFGYEFRYDNNKVDIDKPIEPIPEKYTFLQRLFNENDCGEFEYDQLTINRYQAGQGIPPHVDTHSVFERTILSLSLGSSYVMEFRRGEQKFFLDLPARSLLIMSGQARYGWTHGICPRQSDEVVENCGLTNRPRGTRVSFTFRKVRKSEKCDCEDIEYCDNHVELKSSIDNHIASKLEHSYVHDVYDEIAGHFDETRHKQWPNVTKFIESLDTGSNLLDIGCGNGKYLNFQPGVYKIGCDRSTGLTSICKSKGFQTLVSDCLYLPFKSNCFDAVLCIAVIHHLSTLDRRKRAIFEISRILRTNGKALIYVWAKEQSKDSMKSAYLKFNSKNLEQRGMKTQTILNNVTLPIHENRTPFKNSDMLVPWKLRGANKEFMRFYHVFECGELEQLCSDVPLTKIVESYYDEGNWCIILQKN